MASLDSMFITCMGLCCPRGNARSRRMDTERVGVTRVGGPGKGSVLQVPNTTPKACFERQTSQLAGGSLLRSQQAHQ